MSNILLRCSWAEGQMKGYSGVATYDRDGSDTVESLRARLNNETRRADKAENKATRCAAERDTWKAAYAARGGLPCQFCGEPVKPGRLGRGGYFDRWVHVTRAHDEVCEIAREKAGADAAQARWDAMDEAERAKWTGDRFTAESIVRAWSHPDPVRPTDDLLPEAGTP
jgi:hypothetical protein